MLPPEPMPDIMGGKLRHSPDAHISSQLALCLLSLADLRLAPNFLIVPGDAS